MAYEVEVKTELAREEKDRLIGGIFREKGFTFERHTPQRDFYIEAKQSPYKEQGGSFDLKRYRDEHGIFIYTEKIWELIDGHLGRQEKEYEVTKDIFDAEIAKYPDAVKIEKDRDWFTGEYKGVPISLTIDTVNLSSFVEPRYFIEAEIQVEDQFKVKETKEFIIEFLKDLLSRSEIVTAPGMFKMAFDNR